MTYNSSRFVTARAGYSDRTAEFLARVSELAYIRFEKRTEQELSDVSKAVRAAQTAEEGAAVLDDRIEDLEDLQNRRELKKELTELGFSHFRTYHVESTHTQAILSWSEGEEEIGHLGTRVAVLAFRGSEMVPDDWIRNFSLGDLKLRDGGNSFQVHQGFFEGFKSVQKEIEGDLDALLNQRGYRLYITGHSLGGALAIIATHQIARTEVVCEPQHPTSLENLFGSKIKPNCLFACYTFGSPRVAGEGFAQSIKTPIYRVVNANDVVTRVPPVIFPMVLGKIIEFVSKWLPPLSWPLKKGLPYLIAILSPMKTWKGKLLVSKDILSISEAFVHHGDMRYIRKRLNDKGDVIVLSNPSIWTRARKWLDDWAAWESLYKDHELKKYIAKLGKYSQQRNSKNLESQDL